MHWYRVMSRCTPHLEEQNSTSHKELLCNTVSSKSPSLRYTTALAMAVSSFPLSSRSISPRRPMTKSLTVLIAANSIGFGVRWPRRWHMVNTQRYCYVSVQYNSVLMNAQTHYTVWSDAWWVTDRNIILLYVNIIFIHIVCVCVVCFCGSHHTSVIGQWVFASWCVTCTSC